MSLFTTMICLRTSNTLWISSFKEIDLVVNLSGQCAFNILVNWELQTPFMYVYGAEFFVVNIERRFSSNMVSLIMLGHVSFFTMIGQWAMI